MRSLCNFYGGLIEGYYLAQMELLNSHDEALEATRNWIKNNFEDTDRIELLLLFVIFEERGGGLIVRENLG